MGNNFCFCGMGNKFCFCLDGIFFQVRLNISANPKISFPSTLKSSGYDIQVPIQFYGIYSECFYFDTSVC